jgi:hypothetical protein
MDNRPICHGLLLWGAICAVLMVAWPGRAVERADQDQADPSGAREEVATEGHAAGTSEPAANTSADPDESAPEESATRASRVQYLLDYAQEAYDRMSREVDDYTCIVVKRERVDGRLGGYQFMQAKVRHAKRVGDELTVPFSVYLHFLAPEKIKGREVLYVENQRAGDLIARRGGRGGSPNMTVQLIPSSPLAMEGNRYPITEFGFLNLTGLLIDVLEEELRYNDAEVKIFPNTKVYDRPCTHFRLTHHTRRPDLRYHMAELSVDDELRVPVYFRSFDWPAEDGKPPRLLEEYAYREVKLNVGLTDRDFDVDNDQYRFQLRGREPLAAREDGSVREVPDEATLEDAAAGPDLGPNPPRDPSEARDAQPGLRR